MKKNTVLVVAAHPDDEVLGCGATMARHHDHGDSVHSIIVAEGIFSRKSKDSTGAQRELLDLHSAARAANRVLGVSSLEFHNFPDNEMDSIPRLQVIKYLEEIVRRIRPNIIYTHHSGDLNVDHQRVHDAVMTACRPLPGSSVETILLFEVPSSTEWQPPGSGLPFQPNWFVDVESTFEKKMSALKAYSSEMRDFPHPRSFEGVEALARWRGVTCGVPYAESFMLARNVRKL
jgi:LmbE family N-acetylglucosaminyl deacetylase